MYPFTIFLHNLGGPVPMVPGPALLLWRRDFWTNPAEFKWPSDPLPSN